MVTQERFKLLGTGNPEFDKKLAGGIPLGALVLLEGAADAGKSVLAQYIAHKALASEIAVAYYTTQTTIKDLMYQMSSLELDVTDYFLCDRLRVYPLGFKSVTDSAAALKSLLGHFESLPADLRVIIMDALSDLIAQSEERHVIDFFAGCKRLGDMGRTIIAVVHSDACDEDLLGRVRSISDTHLSLGFQQQGDQSLRVMEVSKVKDVDQPAGTILGFSIEPLEGLKVVPLTGTGG